MIALSCDPPVTAAATSACVGGFLTGYISFATVDVASVVGSPIHPIIGSRITAIISCFATTEGVP